ncbi:hypothetical protein VCJ71_04280 [Alteriqipengyuania sp. WL0013]|uniref:hypothetical protein n=1 Tax=Alteriqipengyuania sp. WL0013 TaxID=3110773 RepID=UPI002C34784E|nr:hypothetical protein [Alteriqipengyuania sp. WL0013]MEB3415277.1 hypothetical protein [Alteriqipengyuania sp. WL0013]
MQLSDKEIDSVGGGNLIPFVGPVIEAAIRYVTATSTDDCTTTYEYNDDGQLVKKTVTCT